VQLVFLNGCVLFAFDELKRELANASLGAIRHGVPFTVGKDASDYALADILSQDGRPAAYMRAP